MPGFCQSASLEEIEAHSYVLTPGSYVGTAPTEAEDVPFEERFSELKDTLARQSAQREELNALIQMKLEQVTAHE